MSQHLHYCQYAAHRLRGLGPNWLQDLSNSHQDVSMTAETACLTREHASSHHSVSRLSSQGIPAGNNVAAVAGRDCNFDLEGTGPYQIVSNLSSEGFLELCSFDCRVAFMRKWIQSHLQECKRLGGMPCAPLMSP